MTATVAALFAYPVKSCAGLALPSARLVRTGLEWDRHWMVVDANGRFLSQRTVPRLALVRPRVAGQGLEMSAPGCETLRVEPGTRPPVVRRVRVWDDACDALDEGDAAAAWLGAFLGQEVRLVRYAGSTPRNADPAYAGDVAAPVAFTDGYPLLVVNLASLEALNAKLPGPLPIERFRPNIVIEGLAPFDEDRIGSLRVGGVVLRLVKPCTRCVITATDQRTGERALDPLPVLRTFRFDRELRGVTFGENAVIAAGGGSTLARGDRVEVTFDT